MPSYDYRCKTCSTRATLVTSIKEKLDIPKCGKCNTEMVRLYVPASVVFKGKGFYSTGD